MPAYRVRRRRRVASLATALAAVVVVAGQALLPTPASAAVSPSLALSRSIVAVNTAVQATGQVPAGSRDVVLQWRSGSGWRRAASGQTASDGSYRLAVPTGWYNTVDYRVVAPADGLLRPAVTTPTARLHVVPSYRPPGKASQHTFLSQAPGPLPRFDPCRTVSYRINLHHAPSHARSQVTHAFKVLGKATGLHFRDAGSVSGVPTTRGFRDPGGITVAWTSARTVPALAGATLGIGGFRDRWSGSINNVHITSGYAVLEAGSTLRRGFGAGKTWGALLLHELGHAVGLGHTSARSQIMYPMLQNRAAARYGKGDLAGLHALGAAQGCIPR
ncbi:matrixin family metalloprotease [Nocardioides terrisoli]|uniref:matrixin family metalloprotease n=1 Tax=Nocardioides terrisoli TaxID=3388267 RepID=UPI00287B7A78|nr:matrixin family metalloprotease [Nocardioides marmorisolisilvae]